MRTSDILKKSFWALAALGALLGDMAYGQTATTTVFPAKPLRIISGAPAGGTNDILSRTLADGLSQVLNQPVMVENKAGAMGIIGTQELLKAPHDGHTLMVAVNGLVSELPHAVKMPIDTAKELYPLAEIAHTGLVMVAAPQLPVNNLKEAIAYAKTNPGKVSFASYSAGSVSHTLGLELNRLAGLDMLHVPFAGSAPAIAQVMGGHLQFMFDGPGSTVPQIKGSKLKALATTAPARLALLPEVPTFAELGYPDMTEVISMMAWITPDVPIAQRNALREAVLKALQLPTVRQRIQAAGLSPSAPLTPEEMVRGLQKASDKQAATLKAIGFKLQ